MSDSSKYEKDYDPEAFSFFALAIVSLIIIPWSIIKYVNKKTTNASKNAANTTYFTPELGEAEKKKKKWSLSTASGWDYTFVGLWIAFLYIIITLPAGRENLRTCQPYQVLDLETGATEREILKRWKDLSKKYHPDKNKNNETAAELFLNITKAKDTLMDPVMRQNCEEFDNPDGPVQQNPKWALPSFFLRYPLITMVLYLFGIVFGLPLLVWRWWRRAKEIGPNGIHYRTVQRYHILLNPGDPSFLNFKVFPHIIIYASSAEFEEPLAAIVQKKYAKEWKVLGGLIGAKYGALKPPKGNIGLMFAKNPLVQCGTLLLQAHMKRIKVPRAFEATLKEMLRKSEELIPAMLQPVVRHPRNPPLGRMCLNVLKFQQHLVQAMCDDEPVWSQIPYKLEDKIKKKFEFGMKRVKTWHDFRNLTEGKKNKIMEHIPDQEKAKQIKAYIGNLPNVDAKYSTHVDGDKDIISGDFVTLEVSLKRSLFTQLMSNGSNVAGTAGNPGSEAGGGGDGRGVGQAANGHGSADNKTAKETKTIDATLEKLPASSLYDGNNGNNEAHDHDEDEDDDSEREEELLDTLSFVDSAREIGSKRRGESDNGVATTSSSGDVKDACDTASVKGTDDRGGGWWKGFFSEDKDEGSESDYATAITPFYPIEKTEGWYVIATLQLPRSPNETLVLDIKKVKFPAKLISEDDAVSANLYFNVNWEAGHYNVSLQVVSDSYVGVDKQVNFELFVGEKREEAKDDDDNKSKTEVDPLDEAPGLFGLEELPPGPWYYLYYPSLTYLIVDMIALALLAMFIFNFLFSRGYWQDYVAPVIEFVTNNTQSVQSGLSSVFIILGIAKNNTRPHDYDDDMEDLPDEPEEDLPVQDEEEDDANSNVKEEL